MMGGGFACLSYLARRGVVTMMAGVVVLCTSPARGVV